ncbi:hypothetical protein ScPMuIL_011865, partial [Solemya velum]
KWEICQWIVAEVLGLEICSSYHLVAITITRYIAVTRSLRFNSIITTRVVLCGIASIWIGSQLSSFLLYILYKPEKTSYICKYEAIFPVTHAGILLVIQLAIPLLIMVILYVRIALIARRQSKVMAAEMAMTSRNHTRPSMFTVVRTELKGTLMVSLLLGCFALAWTPMIIYFFIDIICESCDQGNYV